MRPSPTPWRSLANTPRPDLVVEAFHNLAMDQRGRPEHALTPIYEVTGGGVFPWLLEHTGDITNRGWKNFHMQPYGGYSYESLRGEKVKNTLSQLQKPSFIREVDSSFRRRSESDPDFWPKLKMVLDEYVAAHQELVVYNYTQWLAREAAIALGQRRFHQAERYLERLWDILAKGGARWFIISTAHIPGPDGRPLPYDGPSWSRR